MDAPPELEINPPSHSQRGARRDEIAGGVPTPGNPRGRHSGDTSNARTPQVLEKPKAIALKAIRHNPMAALLKKNEHGNQEAGVSAFGTGTIEEIIVSLRVKCIIGHAWRRLP